MRRLFASLALITATGGVAAADVTPNGISITSFDPEDAVSPTSTVEGPGIKVGDTTIVHPVFGIETGLVSNVFYTNDNNPPPNNVVVGGGVLRLLAQISAGSLDGLRLTPASDSDEHAGEKGEFQYRLSARASWDQVLGDNGVSDTSGLGLGATFRGLTNPGGPWSVGIQDDFQRLIRAANFETDANTNRDINTLGLLLMYHPADSTLGGWLYYNNTIDVFERSEQEFADRMLNTAGVHAQWRWLPQTSVFADVSMGLNTGIGSSKKVSSFPLVAIAGVQTLLSLKTTFGVHGGYTNGFYSSGASYSAPTVGAEIGYRYSPLGRIAFTYDWIYADSVNANFYRDHVLRLWMQQLVSPFVVMVQPELHLREYDGVSTVVPGAMDSRSDTIISVVAGVHYIIRARFAATLDYHFTDVSTSFRYMAGAVPMVDPSFVRHELLVGLRYAM